MKGSADNQNIPLHCWVRDVVGRHTDGDPVLVEEPTLSDEALQVLMHTRTGQVVLKLKTASRAGRWPLS